MRNILKVSLCLIALLSCFNAQARPKKDFEKLLQTAKNAITNYSNEGYYDKFEFTNKKTGLKKKFADFPKLDKQIFMVLQGHNISKTLLEIYEKWQKELKDVKENPGKDEADKKDIENYMQSLLQIRKDNALKVENMLENLFKNNPTSFTKEEQEFITKDIKDFHNKHELIKR